MNRLASSLAVMAAVALAAPQALAQAGQPGTPAERAAPGAEQPVSAAELGQVTLTHADQELLGQLAPSAIAGLQAANLATGKHIPEEIRALSVRSAATQAEINDRIAALERASGIDFPDRMSEEAQAQVNAMRDLNETEFSEAYLAFVRTNHAQALDLLGQVEEGDHAQAVKDMAADLLPEVQAQLEVARDTTVAAMPDEGAEDGEAAPPEESGPGTQPGQQ